MSLTREDVLRWGYNNPNGLGGRPRLLDDKVWCFGKAWCWYCLEVLCDWTNDDREVRDCDCPQSLQQR